MTHQINIVDLKESRMKKNWIFIQLFVYMRDIDHLIYTQGLGDCFYNFINGNLGFEKNYFWATAFSKLIKGFNIKIVAYTFPSIR
jgi:hypothetical protein